MNGIILGYKDYGIIGWLGYPTTALDSLSTSFAAPLWTLTNEFYGSILIFVLARYLLPHSRMSWVILAIVVVLLSRTALLCLVVGHIAARFRLGERAPTLPFPASLALILISTATCIASQFWIPIPFVNFCSLSNQILLPCFFAPAFTMRMYGAIGLTLGVMQCQPLQTRLAHRRFRTLGRLSFPLYLVHWPVIFGVASFVLVVFEPIIGVFAARCVAFLSGVVISAAGAYCFIPIDQMALRISRACRT